MIKTVKKVVLLYKKEGETPLECLGRFREGNKKYKNIKMTYAGRLDPMASGFLLVLVGEGTKEKEKYLGLSKEYKFDVLFGFSTDTHDILGKVVKLFRQGLKSGEVEDRVKENLKYFTGKFVQKYPLYSSKTIKEAMAGRAVERTEHEVSVSSLKFIKIKKIKAPELLANIERRIGKVKGDFRQKEILKIWRSKLEGSKENFLVASFYIKCGSGTYVRSIAYDLGGRIGLPSLALSIKRTKIGKYKKVE